MKSELRRKLSQVEDFSQPDIEKEQYMTPPSLAADIVHTAYMRGDLEGRVLDLGCGTGILGIGAALTGAEVTAVEVDPEVIEVAEKNAEMLNVSDNIEFVESDIGDFSEKVDTVVMNPPFSVHSEEAFKFFRKAFQLSQAVYTVSPRDARSRIKGLADDCNHRILGVEEYSISLPATYGFHTENERETPVDFTVTEKR